MGFEMDIWRNKPLETEEEFKLFFDRNYTDTLLTFLAEKAGNNEKSDEILNRLIEILSNPRPIIQEGAIMGIYKYLDNPKVLSILEYMSENDKSETIRQITKETLDSYKTYGI